MKLNRLAIVSLGGLFVWLVGLAGLAVNSSKLASGVILAALPLYIGVAGWCCNADRKTPFSLMPYFFGSVFVFFCIGIVLWPLASFSPYEFNSLVAIEIDSTQLAQTASFLGISISITMLAFSQSSKWLYQQSIVTLDQMMRENTLGRLGLRLMIIALPVVTYRLYKELSHILEVGYLALYAEGIGSADTVSWAIPFNYIFYTGFSLVCAYVKDKKTFTFAITMFLVVALLDGLKGARGAVIVPILFCWWFFSSQFGVTLRIGRLLGYMTLALALFLGLTISRDSSSIEGTASQFVIDSVATQARSLQLTAIYLQERDEIAKYGNYMITSNLMIPINVFLHPELRDVPQSIDQVTYSNNLKHILTYTLNSDYYFAGGGTGGVYLIELIESGWGLFVFFSALLGWFLARWPSFMQIPFWRFVSFQIFSTVFYMPRAEYFPNLQQFGKSALIFIAILFFVDLTKGLSLRLRVAE